VVQDSGVVAQLVLVSRARRAEALVGQVAGVVLLVGAVPVWATVFASIASPSRMADAKILE